MAREYGREKFRELTEDLWSAFRWVRDRDPIRGNDAERLAQLADEVALRELVSTFAYSIDSKNPEWTAALFTEDGSLMQLGGDDRRSEGRAAIVEHSRSLGGLYPFSRHRATNFIVRIMPGRREAWLTAYLHVATTGKAGQIESHFGHYLGRFERNGERWYFADWCRSIDFVLRYTDDSGRRENDLPLQDPELSLRPSRAWAAERHPRIDGGRATWVEMREDAWNAHHWLLDQKTPALGSSERLEQMVDEVAIRETLSNYAYAHDSRDLGWSASLFADDAILYNEMMNCIGNAEVVEAFRRWNAGMLLTFHRFSNPVLKFVPGGEEAWLMAYFNVAALRFDRTGYTFGRYFSRFTKRSGRWQIIDWRISPDARMALTLEGSAGWELVEWHVDSEMSVPLVLHSQGDRRGEVAR